MLCGDLYLNINFWFIYWGYLGVIPPFKLFVVFYAKQCQHGQASFFCQVEMLEEACMWYVNLFLFILDGSDDALISKAFCLI